MKSALLAAALLLIPGAASAQGAAVLRAVTTDAERQAGGHLEPSPAVPAETARANGGKVRTLA